MKTEYELTPDTPQSLGIETVKLIVEPEATATTKAIQLVQQAR